MGCKNETEENLEHLVSLRKGAQAWDEHILPDRHSLCFKRYSASVYLYACSEKSRAQGLAVVMQVYLMETCELRIL